MKEKILYTAIENLRHEGLKFSVDTLASQLGLSKKTIYKFFPDKEALALALYEKYYADAKKKAAALLKRNAASIGSDLLFLYFDAKIMTRRVIFNKYKLNAAIQAYTTEQNDALWEIICLFLEQRTSGKDRRTLRVIIDGSFEKLCSIQLNPDAVIERLVELL